MPDNEKTGTVKPPSPGHCCSMATSGFLPSTTVSLTARTDAVLTFSEPQTAACVAGTVTLTRQGAGLAYRWTDNVEQNTGTLSHG